MTIKDPSDIEKSVEDLIKYGRAFGGSGNHKKALYYFKLALNKDSKNVIALRGKGYALYNLGKYFDAIEGSK